MPHGTRFESYVYCGAPVAWPRNGITDTAYREDDKRYLDQVHHCTGLCRAAHSGRADCLISLASRVFG